MPKERESRLYRKRGRFYGDFRDLGGKLEALKPPGETRATMDPDVAASIATARVAELETRQREEREEAGRRERSRVLLGIDREARLGEYAEHHLVEKRKAGRVTTRWLAVAQLHLERAVSFLGTGRPLQSIGVRDVRALVEHLRTLEAGRGGTTRLSDSTVRHHLNTLSNLYRRAQAEACVPPGYNPVAALLEKPQAARSEARWLEVPDAALYLESARTWKPDRDAHACPFMHALVATFLLTGGRKSEVLGLEVDDVSFDRKTVTFRPNEHRRLKTRSAHRTAPLWPQLEPVLRAHVFGGSGPRAGLLFPSSRTGRRMHDTRKALDEIAERASWKAGEIRTRIFRHTYCAARLQTLDRGAPVSPWTVAREMGHGGRSLVDRVYGHLGDVRQRGEVVEYRVEHHEEALGERLKRLRSSGEVVQH